MAESSNRQSHFVPLNLLHILNDGFQASFVLLLPFVARAQDLSLTEVGSLGTVLNIASVVLALPAGFIAAKVGGLRTLVAALVVYGLGFLGAGVFGQYALLLLMFGLGGIGLGMFHPIAFSLIAKWAPKERRGRLMGNFTAIGDVGRIGISAALSFVVVAIGWQQTAVLYGAVAVALAFGFYRFLKAQGEGLAVKDRVVTPMSLGQIVRNRRYVLAMCTSAFDAFASASLYVFLPFLLLKRGVSPAFLGTFTAAFFVGNFLGKTLLGRFVDRLGNVPVFVVSELLMAMFIFVLANSTLVWLIVVCSVVLGAFTKGTVPVIQTMVTESVEHHGNFEKAFGLGALVTSCAVTAAPLLLGVVSDRAGIVTAFNVMAGVALIAVVPAVAFAVVGRQRRAS